MFDKILVPIDGSKPSIKALKQAVDIAEICKTKQVMLLNVIKIDTSGILKSRVAGTFEPSVGAAIATSEAINAMKKSRKRILNTAEAKVKKIKKNNSFSLNSILLEGDPVDEIVKFSKKEKMNLIIMGARGMNKVKELLLGSVSDGVCRHSSCPVMIVK
jgi:nucleotide-binding universal stress UspA family protein